MKKIFTLISNESVPDLAGKFNELIVMANASNPPVFTQKGRILSVDCAIELDFAALISKMLILLSLSEIKVTEIDIDELFAILPTGGIQQNTVSVNSTPNQQKKYTAGGFEIDETKPFVPPDPNGGFSGITFAARMGIKKGESKNIEEGAAVKLFTPGVTPLTLTR